MNRALIALSIVLFVVLPASAARQVMTSGSGATHQWSVQKDRINSNFVETYGHKVASGTVSGSNLTLTLADTSTISIDVSTLVNTDAQTITNMSLNASTNILTVALSGGNTATADLTGLITKAQTIDASGFDGNLTTSDNTIQKVAQKLDDLVAGAGSGDITGITAGTGLTGGGDSGAVTIGLSTATQDAIAANTAKISFDSTSSARLANTSGTNTGDNATNTQYSGLAASKQDADSDLTAIAALTTTAFGRGVLDDADAAALRTTAGLTANGQSLVTAANYAAMRTLLDLEVGTDFNAYDADITSYASVTPSANALTLLGHNFASMRTDLGLVIGTNVQAYDADLTSWAGITPSSNGGSLVSAANYAAMKGLLDTDDMQTALGIAAGNANLGLFTGTVITENTTVKTALQELETEVELKANMSDIATVSTDVATMMGSANDAEILNNIGAQPAVSGVSSTEIGYLDGVTSGIQAQINAITVGSPITTAPTYSDDTCTKGQYAISTSPSMYWCIDTNTWDYQVVSGSGLVWAGWDNPTPVTPTLTSRVIGTDGVTLTLTGSASLSVGAGGSGGFDVDCSTAGNGITATYSSGAPGSNIVYTLGTTVNSGDTCDLDYTQPGNGIEATTGGADLASITSAAITNNSTETGGGPAASDTFTGTDTTLLTAHTSDSSHSWTKQGSAGELVINGNKINANAADAFTAFYSSFTPTDANYSVFADFSSSSTGGTTPFICGRISTTERTAYCVNYAAGTWTLARWSAGSRTSLGTYTGDDPVSTPLTVELVMASTKSVKIGGVERITSADNTITAAGRPGVGIYYSDASTLRNIDNWEVTD